MAGSGTGLETATGAKKLSKTGNVLYSQRLAPYIFVFPFIVSFCVFFAYPVFSTIVMSFQEVLPGATKFVGLENYKNLLNPTFYKAVKNSTVYTALTLLILIPIPLLLAVFLNSKTMMFKNFFRSVTFVPALISIVVAGIIFRLMFSGQETGLANQFIAAFGFEKVAWLNSYGSSLAVLIALALFRWMGVNLLYFLAGLQNIPASIYEAAEIDGAGTWQKFSKITLPLLKPISIYVLTISIYGGYSMFVESYMLFAGNKSPNDIGLTIVGYLYRSGIEKFELGFGSSVGIALLLITFTITLIQLKFTGMFKKED
ncbi:sugar ABC transporter permease [Paenibacillus sp. TRM 82003]|nr:sugar ABC transporter permease [Paenibacillus sp. TRM 82003]